MRVILSLFVGILGIIIGYCFATIVSYGLSGLAGMSDLEGGRATFAVFFKGPTGAFLGLFLGGYAGWKLGGGPFSTSRLMILFLVGLSAFGLVWELLVMG